MLVEVKGPELSDWMADPSRPSWHKKVGDPPLARDENLIDVETDKVVLDFPFPRPASSPRS